ncbi:hypothetical protein [Actinoplanes utahensis]|uniref:hypothetical protein n=1 Tax=Actinoplanes utahensis TaxID=1869 RepID=UPI0006919A91|nr:hypothetical protein [Actinoplanes utahensis]GIF32736.1 hypothetical protein Aut01nite_57220 [Actinoplanes utahensis]
MDDLRELNDRWWDWQVERWDVAALRLVADNDLTYHHSVEVTFSDVAWVSCADLFHHPVFRDPTPAERGFAGQVTGDDEYRLFAWDAETAAGTVPMMIIARDVRIESPGVVVRRV